MSFSDFFKKIGSSITSAVQPVVSNVQAAVGTTIGGIFGGLGDAISRRISGSGDEPASKTSEQIPAKSVAADGQRPGILGLSSSTMLIVGGLGLGLVAVLVLSKR